MGEERTFEQNVNTVVEDVVERPGDHETHCASVMLVAAGLAAWRAQVNAATDAPAIGCLLAVLGRARARHLQAKAIELRIGLVPLLTGRREHECVGGAVLATGLVRLPAYELVLDASHDEVEVVPRDLRRSAGIKECLQREMLRHIPRSRRNLPPRATR